MRSTEAAALFTATPLENWKKVKERAAHVLFAVTFAVNLIAELVVKGIRRETEA